MSKIAWFILGLILGCAVGLFLATITDGRYTRPAAVTESGPAAAPVAPQVDETPTPAPAPARIRPPRPAPPARRHESAEDGAQVQEDAAAAGLTSRAARPAPVAEPAPDAAAPPSDSTPG